MKGGGLLRCFLENGSVLPMGKGKETTSKKKGEEHFVLLYSEKGPRAGSPAGKGLRGGKSLETSPMGKEASSRARWRKRGKKGCLTN